MFTARSREPLTAADVRSGLSSVTRSTSASKVPVLGKASMNLLTPLRASRFSSGATSTTTMESTVSGFDAACKYANWPPNDRPQIENDAMFSVSRR